MKTEKKTKPETVGTGNTRYFSPVGKEITKEEFFNTDWAQPAKKTSADVKKATAYHAGDSDVYHIFDDCTVGNNIEPDKRKEGTGGKRLCQVCKAKKGER